MAEPMAAPTGAPSRPRLRPVAGRWHLVVLGSAVFGLCISLVAVAGQEVSALACVVVEGVCLISLVAVIAHRIRRRAWWRAPVQRGVIAFATGLIILVLGEGWATPAHLYNGAFPLRSELAATVAYPLLVVGVLMLLRRPDTTWDRLLEALLVTSMLEFLAWDAVTRHFPHLDGTTLWFALARPGVDLVLVLLAAHLHDSEVTRFPVGPWLCIAIGASLQFLADVVWGLGVLVGLHPAPRLLVVTALGGWSLLAAGCIHPRFADGSPPGRHRAVRLNLLRIIAVMGAVLIGPALLVTELGHRPTRTLANLALGSVALSGLAVTYLVQLVDEGARLKHFALHDDLTGLPNRVLFTERLSASIASAHRGTPSVAVLYLDLDRFKTVNDSLGHAAGNEVLIQVAARLRGAVRQEDMVARLAGDEFTALLENVDEVEANATADRILEAFVQPLQVAGRELFVTPSVGIALGPGDGEGVEQLMKNADAAMYRAKSGRIGRPVQYSPAMSSRAKERLALESSLHKALDRNELVLYYQPKVDLRSGSVIGVEALARWQHHEHGLLLPKDFIPLAEETGLIVPLGEWALMTACAQTKTWRDAGHEITVAVNLSVRQFHGRPMGDVVASVLRQTGLEASALELELTESIAVEDQSWIISTLEDIKSMGVSCSIDDFGTGYSSLSYLTRLPIDTLKIDRSFVSRIGEGADESRIVAAVIALAHQLGLTVIAEGVETAGQADFLQRNGCDTVQGFLVGHPVPADQLEALLMAGPEAQARLAKAAAIEAAAIAFDAAPIAFDAAPIEAHVNSIGAAIAAWPGVPVGVGAPPVALRLGSAELHRLSRDLESPG